MTTPSDEGIGMPSCHGTYARHAVLRLTVTSFATALLLLPVDPSLSADVQPVAELHRIGVMANTCIRDPENVEAFFDGLRELGYVEGENLVIECRDSAGHAERWPELAAELIDLKVDLIMVWTTPAALAAKAVTSAIPILIVAAHDPVGAGLAASLARPGGNVTGLATLFPELSAKRLELLRELIPRASHVAVLWNGANPANSWRCDRQRMRRTTWGSRSNITTFGPRKTSKQASPQSRNNVPMHCSCSAIPSCFNVATTSPPSPCRRACPAVSNRRRAPWPAG